MAKFTYNPHTNGMYTVEIIARTLNWVIVGRDMKYKLITWIKLQFKNNKMIPIFLFLCTRVFHI